MKRYLTYILLIISSICYGQIYSTANSNIQYNGFQSTSYYNQPVRGYNNYDRDINYSSPRFGYRTSIGYSTYKKSFNLNSIHSGETYYIPSYSSDPNYSGENSSYKGGPRKVSGIGGWWDWLNWGMLHGVPSSVSNEEMYAYRDYVNNGGTYSYNDWYNNIYNVSPGGPPSPDDPFADPVGEFPISLLLICAFGYAYYKKYKNDK